MVKELTASDVLRYEKSLGLLFPINRNVDVDLSIETEVYALHLEIRKGRTTVTVLKRSIPK